MNSTITAVEEKITMGDGTEVRSIYKMPNEVRVIIGADQRSLFDVRVNVPWDLMMRPDGNYVLISDDEKSLVDGLQSDPKLVQPGARHKAFTVQVVGRGNVKGPEGQHIIRIKQDTLHPGEFSKEAY